jgi:hypothetical protein
MGQRRAYELVRRFCLLAYPCQVGAHRGCTPGLVSVFPLARVLARGTFPSTGMSRFIARPGPVPLPSHHGNGFFDVARPSAGWHDPRGSRHARMAPLPLCGAMRSATPGARPSRACAWTDAWLARRSRRSADTPSLPFSGLCGRCRASTLHLAERPLPQQWFRAVGSTFPRKASVMRRSLPTFLLSSGSEPG